MNVRLSAEARDGWQVWADSLGTTLTALLEVIGLRLAAGNLRSLRLDELGRQARGLSAERRRRV